MSRSARLTMPTVQCLTSIAKGLTRIGDIRLRTLGFATAQLPVLAGLKDGEALSQAELVRLARVEQPSMAQLLARMERDGIIHRDPDPNDRRSSLVKLTDDARAKIPAASAILKKSNTEVTAGFSAAEMAMLDALLRRVLANVEAMEAESAPSSDQGSKNDVS